MDTHPTLNTPTHCTKVITDYISGKTYLESANCHDFRHILSTMRDACRDNPGCRFRSGETEVCYLGIVNDNKTMFICRNYKVNVTDSVTTYTFNN